MEIAQGEVDTKHLVEEFRENENKNNDVCAVILNVNNSTFGIDNNTYDISFFGKTMTEWVANSVYDTEIRYGNIDEKQDFLPVAKRLADTTKKWTIVLFSDTPLFERSTFLEIMEYVKLKSLSVLKLTRGYVFDTNYLEKIDCLFNPQTQYFNEEDFITCYSLKQISVINEIFKNRILDYFMNKGVIIKDPASTFIDADAQIGKNTVIEPFNIIKGESIIEENVQLESGNIISNSIICSNVKILKSVISDSYIGSDAIVNSDCSIVNNTKVDNGVAIPSYCELNGVVVTKENELKSFHLYTSKEEEK